MYYLAIGFEWNDFKERNTLYYSGYENIEDALMEFFNYVKNGFDDEYNLKDFIDKKNEELENQEGGYYGRTLYLSDYPVTYTLDLIKKTTERWSGYEDILKTEYIDAGPDYRELPVKYNVELLSEEELNIFQLYCEIAPKGSITGSFDFICGNEQELPTIKDIAESYSFRWENSSEDRGELDLESLKSMVKEYMLMYGLSLNDREWLWYDISNNCYEIPDVYFVPYDGVDDEFLKGLILEVAMLRMKSDIH